VNDDFLRTGCVIAVRSYCILSANLVDCVDDEDA